MFKKILAGLALAVTAASFAYADFYVQRVQWQKFLGKVIFTNTVEFQGETSITGSIADLTLTDDLTVGDDATVTGDLTVTGSASTTPVIQLGTSSQARVYRGTTTLTEAGGVETILTVTNATTQATSGTLTYHIKGSDGTDHQSTVGTLIFTMVNKAGTVTSTFLPATIAAGITQESATQALSSGTFTGAFDSTEAANSTVISINIDSSLTLTSASMEWVLVLQGPGTVS